MRKKILRTQKENGEKYNIYNLVAMQHIVIWKQSVVRPKFYGLYHITEKKGQILVSNRKSEQYESWNCPWSVHFFLFVFILSRCCQGSKFNVVFKARNSVRMPRMWEQVVLSTERRPSALSRLYCEAFWSQRMKRKSVVGR